MRVFLPLESGDFQADTPPAGRQTFEADLVGLKAEDADVAAEDALDDAAFASLALVLEGCSAPRRIVAVGDSVETWAQVEAFYVDDAQTASLILEARGAETQEQLDDLAEAIMSRTMDWYDTSEFGQLRTLV